MVLAVTDSLVIGISAKESLLLQRFRKLDKREQGHRQNPNPFDKKKRDRAAAKQAHVGTWMIRIVNGIVIDPGFGENDFSLKTKTE